MCDIKIKKKYKELSIKHNRLEIQYEFLVKLFTKYELLPKLASYRCKCHTLSQGGICISCQAKDILETAGYEIKIPEESLIVRPGEMK
jgi:hypothetical protein